MRALAAGSLRTVWPRLMAHFPEPVETRFGPAGLLRERISAGEPCDLFASASLDHPQTLLTAGKARRVLPFASNSLCLTVRSDRVREGEAWHALLDRDDLRIATSTPVADPSGDYAQLLFDRMGDAGARVRRRARALVGGRDSAARALVGGRDSAPVPQGKMAAEWIIHSGQAEIFIGYASYAPALRQREGLTVITLPESVNPQAVYASAVITRQGQRLADFLRSDTAQAILREAGFGACPGGEPPG
ncbi:substrate-binding domain-containing protein [Pseudenterobacter timonensis]|uniref:substrate-binding domain-containing protein n=1 Tax=Pseudenterobacter timonensis TaxID=1755099 RepID=UPI00077B757C|nr:substrate-binding domain-containing protein [Pseudenterobacter timonensis]